MEGDNMEYVYAAMLLHRAKQQISEENVKKVLQAAGVSADDARVRALVAALEGVNIDEAIEKASVVAAAPAAAAQAAAPEKKKEEKKDDGAAAAGLGALFG